MKKLMPKFRSKSEEFEFWSSTGAGADSTKYVDWAKAKRARFPNLRSSSRVTSIRLPVWMIKELQVLANRRGMSYRSLLKVFLTETIDEERGLIRAD